MCGITLYTGKLRILFILYDYGQSTIYKTILSRKHDHLWNIMVDTVYKAPLKLRKLGLEEIMILCHKFVYYCAEHIGIETDRLEKIFSSIDSDLRSFVEELLKNDDVNVLPLSQMKALNLVKGGAGLECMDDIAIIEAFLKNTILIGNREEAEDNFDVVKWHDNKNKRIEKVKEIKTKIENNKNQQYKDSNSETELEENASMLAVI